MQELEHGRSAREGCPLHMPWPLCSWTHCSYGYLDAKGILLGNLRALGVDRIKNIVCNKKKAKNNNKKSFSSCDHVTFFL